MIKKFESYININGELNDFFNDDEKLIYPWNELQHVYEKYITQDSLYAQKQGWEISAWMPVFYKKIGLTVLNKYEESIRIFIVNPYEKNRFQIRLNELGPNKQVIELAKKMGYMFDSNLLIGYNGENIVAKINDGLY